MVHGCRPQRVFEKTSVKLVIIVLRRCQAPFGCLPPAFWSSAAAAFNSEYIASMTDIVTQEKRSEIMSHIRESLLSRFSHPESCFCRIHLHALPSAVHRGEAELGRGIALSGRPLKQLEGLPAAASHTIAIEVHDGKADLGGQLPRAAAFSNHLRARAKSCSTPSACVYFSPRQTIASTWPPQPVRCR